MKRVLVTGATGFIGKHCLPLLLEKNYEVHGLFFNSTLERTPEVIWHQANLLDLTQVETLLKNIRPTHLLHFAWYTTPGKYWTSLENLYWVQASLALFRNFQKEGGQRAVIAGTCAEYDWNYGYCSEFITLRNPTTPYGICKNALQEMLDVYSNNKSFTSAWGRIFFLYGPHEYPSRLVPSVIRSLLHGKPAQCSHGNQIRDFLYVKDAADAFVQLLENDIHGPVNIASGQLFALKDLINKIAQKLDRQDLVQLNVIPNPTNDPNFLGGDIKRLHDQVGWEPNYNLDTGLDQTINWWKGITNKVA